MRPGIRTKLTAASAALVAVVLLAVGAFVYMRFEADLLEAVDAGLRSRTDALLSTPSGPSLSTGGLVEADDAFVQILSPDGAVLGSTPGVSDALVDRAATDGFESTTVQTTEERVPARILIVALDDGRTLIVGASLDDQQEALGRLATSLLVGGPVALGFVVLVVWLIVGAAFRPVEAMRSEAAAISATEPGRRLPVPASDDEIARLGRTLNEMLGRLEEAFERERRFVDDASHELRTPLANLRAELDLALRRFRTAAELEAALRSASEETDRLVRLAEDLLVLARAKGGRLPVRREEVDVAAIVRETVHGFDGRAAERGISLDLDLKDGVMGNLDPVRVRQALGNLLDNAFRHTPSKGCIRVRAARRDGVLTLSVADTGSGFTAAFVDRAFEPFSRDDASRSRADGGVGLGLTIVRAIAEGHGGSVEASNREGGGAEITLRFPG